MIVLDDIENLLSYVRLGGRFSNDVLQALLVLCKKVPEEKGRKVIVIGITSQLRDMDSLGLKDIFNVTLEMPNVQPSEIPTVMKQFIAAALTCSNQLIITQIFSLMRTNPSNSINIFSGVRTKIKRILRN